MKDAPTQKFHTMSDLRRAQLWLDGQVAKSAGAVTAQVVTMSPELAEVLLGRNEGNRKLKARRVDDFSRDMAAGNWKLNGEPVIVSSEGRLNDGQHRCAAVIQSKVPVEMLIVFGVDRDSRDTLDHGTARSPGDDLALHGHTNTIVLAATARMLWQWRQYGTVQHSGVKAPTRVELMATVDQNPGIIRAILAVGSKGAKAKAVASVAMLAFCHFAFKTVANDADVTFFFDALIEGENLKRGDPILNARNRLIAERRILGVEERVELLFRAWNAHRRGETARVAFRLTGGELPLLES